MHILLRVSGTMQNSEKSKIQFQENTQADVRRQGWTDPIS